MYLFAYFKNNGEDGLHLAYSENGYHYHPLNGDTSFVTPDVGEAKLMRDPNIIQGPDGTFHMVWTTSWKGVTIGYSSSKDLVHWTDQQAIPVMAHEPECQNCWAPEIAYDQKSGQFVIFWSTTITGRFPETINSGDNNHRLYAVTTRDFKTFSDTYLYYDPGFNVIDATFMTAGGELFLIVKDESKNPVQKNLRVARADSVLGPFHDMSGPFTESWVEGPTAIRVGEDTVVFYDCYTAHRYGAVRTRDAKSWQDISDQISIPHGARHGTIIPVDEKYIRPLVEMK